jgi:hypothetical protein
MRPLGTPLTTRTERYTVTINLLAPAPEVSAETAQRDGHMTALSVAEHIISTSPVIPTELETHCKPWSVNRVELVLHFFDAPAAVRHFGEHFKLSVYDAARGDHGTDVIAEGVISGVQVRAWCRVRPTPDESAARLAGFLAPVVTA